MLLSMPEEIRLKHHQSEHVKSMSYGFFALTCIQLFMSILLISRLESVVLFYVYMMLLPVVILAGCCSCTVPVGLCFLSWVPHWVLTQRMR